MELEHIAAKLKPVLGEAADTLWLLYKTGSPAERKEIESLFYILAAEALDETFESKHILMPPPPRDIAEGEYPLGTVQFGPKNLWPFGLREKEWIQHVAIFGRTGSGKTNVGFLIAQALAAKNKPFLVLDWKRNYRDLLQMQEFRGASVYTVGRELAPFSFNPLMPPPGTQPKVWLKKLIEIMCHVYYLGEGVAYLLQKAIDDVYNAHGVYGRAQAYPTLQEVLKWLQSYKAKGREAQWMDSALRTLATLCFGETGKVLNSAPVNIPDLLRRQAILELDALDNADKTFLIEALLLWIHHYRMQEPERESFKHAIIIEEAHHVLLRRKQSKESIMDIILREIRELGEAIIVLDQHPSLISVPSLGNTYCTIAMGLKHGSDVSAISRAVQLTTEEEGYLGRLETGYGIARLQGRWHKPYLVRFPDTAVKKGAVTDAALRGKEGSSSGASRDILPLQNAQETILPLREGANLNEGETRLLKDIAEHPFSGTVERYARLALSVYKGNQLGSALQVKGFLVAVSIPIGRGRLVLHQLTETALEWLANRGYKILAPRRNASLEHEYWRAKVKELLVQHGYEVEEEAARNGGRADLLARQEGKTIAVEIETGLSDALDNVQRNLEAGYHQVIVVTTKPKLKKVLEKKLSAELTGRILVVYAPNLARVLDSMR